jgi:hypothetical protein
MHDCKFDDFVETGKRAASLAEPLPRLIPSGLGVSVQAELRSGEVRLQIEHMKFAWD